MCQCVLEQELGGWIELIKSTFRVWKGKFDFVTSVIGALSFYFMHVLSQIFLVIDTVYSFRVLIAS